MNIVANMVTYNLGSMVSGAVLNGMRETVTKGLEFYTKKVVPNLLASRRVAREGMVGAAIKAAAGRAVQAAHQPNQREISAGLNMFKRLEGRIGNVSRVVNRGISRAATLAANSRYDRYVNHHLIKEELSSIPVQYAMYRYQKYQGEVDQKENFARYYAKQAPVNLISSKMMHSAGQFAKKTMAAFNRGGGRAWMQMSTAVAMEGVHMLAEKTRAPLNIYRNLHARINYGNTSTGYFSGGFKMAKEAIKGTRYLGRNKTDWEVYSQRLKAMNVDPEIKKELIYSFNAQMDRGKLMKAYSKHVKAINRVENRIMGGSDRGFLEHVVENSRMDVKVGKKTMSVIKSREIYQYMGKEYDFGHLHLDRIRDGVNEYITRGLRILNRPWAKYFDAERNILMSNRTRALSYSVRAANVPGNIGMVGASAIQIGSPSHEDLFDDRKIEGLKTEEDLRKMAVGVTSSWFNIHEKNAANFLDQNISSTVAWANKHNLIGAQKKYATETDLRNTYYVHFLGNAQRGTFELAAGQQIDLMGGHPKIINAGGVRDMEGKLHDHTMYFHYKGADGHMERLKTAYVTTGATRMGQMAGFLAGGQSEYNAEIGGLHMNVKVGQASNYNRKVSDELSFGPKNPEGFLGKMLDYLELGRGHETSIWSKMGSMFSKHKDMGYFPTIYAKYSQSKNPKEEFDKLFRSRSSAEVNEVSAGIESASNEIIGRLHQAFRVAGNFGSGEIAHTPTHQMLDDMMKIARAAGQETNSFNIRDFSFKDYVINERDTTTTAAQKLADFSRLQSEHQKVFEAAGFDPEPFYKLRAVLDSTHDKDPRLAVGGTLKDAGDAIDRYHKSLFGFVTNSVIEGAYKNQSSGAGMKHVDELASYLSSIHSRSHAIIQPLGRAAKVMEPEFIRSALLTKRNANKFTRPNYEAEGNERDDLFKEMMVMGEGYQEHFGSIWKSLAPNARNKSYVEVKGAENSIVVLTEPLKGIKSGSIKKVRMIGASGDNTHTDVAIGPIKRSSVEILASANTMNSALGLVGLGFDVDSIRTFGDVVSKTITRRVLPAAVVMAGMDAWSNYGDQIPLLKDTPFAHGPVGFAWDAYAGMRVASQYISDMTGITSVAKWAEDLMPGIIDSPLSGIARSAAPLIAGLKIGGRFGRVGMLHGGIVGGMVGAVLGGGPAGLFDDNWNISKGREEVLAELKGEKEVAVKKARFWEMGGNAWEGEGVSFYRPSLYFIQKKQALKASNAGTDDLVTRLTSYVDPSVYARQHYFSRPYPVAGGVGTNLPLIGAVFRGLPGNVHKYHEEYLQNYMSNPLLNGEAGQMGIDPGLPGSPGVPTMGAAPTQPNPTLVYGAGMTFGATPLDGPQMAGRLPAGNVGAFFGGQRVGGYADVKPPVYDNDSAEAIFSDTAAGLFDVAGLRGFVTGSLLESVTGSKSVFSGNRVMEDAGKIGSTNRMFYGFDMGGLAGLNEGIRRILPRNGTDTAPFNPIPNTQAMWMPGTGSFINFLEGDPYSKTTLGEIRLPGQGYELTHDVAYTYPIDSVIMGKTMEEQVSFYAGDTAYLAGFRRKWDVVERTRDQIVGQLKKDMNIIRETQIAYDPNNDVAARVDGIIQNQDGSKAALAIAPMDENDIDSGGESQLNAFLVMNDKNITQGILVGMDESGNITKRLVQADLQRFQKEVQDSMRATETAKKVTVQLQKEGYSTNRGNAYSHLNRLQILVNIAPFAKETQLEMKIVQAQKQAGKLGNEGDKTYHEIMTHFTSHLSNLGNSEYRFIPYLQGKTPIGTQAVKRMAEVQQKYTKQEAMLGAIWEYTTHLRIPGVSRLLNNQSALEEYRTDMAIGRGFKQWQSPVEDFIGSPMSMVAAETSPLQAGLSAGFGGALLGGPIGAALGAGAGIVSSVTGLTDNSRSARLQELDRIQESADLLRYTEATALQSQLVGKERSLTLRRNQAMYNVYGTKEVAGYRDVLTGMSQGERKYVKAVMDNLYAEDVTSIAKLMPQASAPLFQSWATGDRIDSSYYAGRAENIKQTVQGLPLQFSSDDVVYNTMNEMGVRATDAGLGFYAQANRVRYMNATGANVPTMNMTPNGFSMIPTIR